MSAEESLKSFEDVPKLAEEFLKSFEVVLKSAEAFLKSIEVILKSAEEFLKSLEVILRPVRRGGSRGSSEPPFHPGQLRSPEIIALAWLGSYVSRSSTLAVDLAFEHRERKLRRFRTSAISCHAFYLYGACVSI